MTFMLPAKEIQKESKDFIKPIHTVCMGAQAVRYWTTNPANMTNP